MIDYDDGTYTNSPPVRDIWQRALPALVGVKNGDYLRPERLHRALGYSGGQKLRDLLAAAERDGLLIINRGATPTTYRATFILERCVRSSDANN